MSIKKLPQVLVDYAWYADGIGKIGLTPKIKLPMIKTVTEEYIGSGMSGHIDIDMGCVEKMVCTVTLAEPDPQMFKLFGLTNGEEKQFTFRSALQGRGEVVPLLVQMRALVLSIDVDEIQRKQLTNIDLELTVSSLRIVRGDEELVDIDVEGGKLSIGGENRRNLINSALGI